MKIVVTGGAGFLGSHLVQHLVQKDHEVYSIDNFLTGQEEHTIFCDNFTKADISDTYDMKQVFEQISASSPIDVIYNLACPASPDHYQKHSLKTLDTCYTGVKNILEAAKQSNAMVIHTSTSEVYGNPDHTPQEETYYGNVNSFGPRACYDEGKRVAEALIFEYTRLFKTDVKIARIFNTYGPRMSVQDGRVISNFICNALQNKDLLLYGDGNQSRSFCYVSDTIHGLLQMMNTTRLKLPINIGNPSEYTVKEIAELVISMTSSTSGIMSVSPKKDDPLQRCPDINRAKELLHWTPQVGLVDGLKKTVEYFEECLQQEIQT